MRKIPKFSPEVRERAVRMQEHRHEHPSQWAAINPSPARSAACRKRCTPGSASMRSTTANVKASRRGSPAHQGVGARGARTAQGQRSQTGQRVFARRTRPPHQVLKAFVDQHRQQFGVESICRAMQIAPSAYWRHAARWRNPALCSRRAQRDASLVPLVQRVAASQLPGLRGRQGLASAQPRRRGGGTLHR